MVPQPLKGAGSVRALPVLSVATLQPAAIFSYQPASMPAMDLAAMHVALRFGLPTSRARIIAEMAGMGGKP